jgi:M-phase inducer tyrosine phosphatase
MSTFRNPGEDYDRINANALCKILRDKGQFDKVVVIDCRGRHEFAGGHLKVAVNAQSPEDLEEIFQKFYSEKTCFVFHCEYSQVRAPSRLEDFRQICESHGITSPPTCYVLDRGYKGFYLAHQDYCVDGYTQEHDKH